MILLLKPGDQYMILFLKCVNPQKKCGHCMYFPKCAAKQKNTFLKHEPQFIYSPDILSQDEKNKRRRQLMINKN